MACTSVVKMASIQPGALRRGSERGIPTYVLDDAFAGIAGRQCHTPVQVWGHDELQGVPSPKLNLVATLNMLLLKGAVHQALQVHERHLGTDHRRLREGVQDVRNETCSAEFQAMMNPCARG